MLKSTIADTQTLSKDYANLAQAQAIYGKNSRQAAVATAQLNFDMKDLGNTAGVKAEAGLAKATTALNTFWDLQTSGARVQAVAIMQQGVTLGHEYVPMIADAAQRNLAIINSGLKPLFAWLQGPDGIGIFNNLENLFANEPADGRSRVRPGRRAGHADRQHRRRRHRRVRAAPRRAADPLELDVERATRCRDPALHQRLPAVGHVRQAADRGHLRPVPPGRRDRQLDHRHAQHGAGEAPRVRAVIARAGAADEHLHGPQDRGLGPDPHPRSARLRVRQACTWRSPRPRSPR